MLTEIMGDYPQIRVIEILITHPWSEYTKKDLSEASGISRSTLYTLLNKLETYQIIKPTRKIGNTQLYTLNQESNTSRAIMAFGKELSNIEIEKQKNTYQQEPVNLTDEELDEHLGLKSKPAGDAETKKLREELGITHVLNKEALRPEARGKTGAEIIRAQRENMKRYG